MSRGFSGGEQVKNVPMQEIAIKFVMNSFFVLLFVLFLKFLSSVHKKNENVKYMSENGFHFSTNDEFT